MEKAYSVQGMSCQHCVSRVKNSLEKIPGVLKAEVTLDTQQAVLFTEGPIEDVVVQDAVKKAGHYQILS